MESKASETRELPQFVRQIIVLVIMLAGINGVLWACQEIASSESKQEYQSKKTELDQLKNRLDECKVRLDSYKSMAVGNTLPLSTYNAYKQDLEGCNSIMRKHNDLVPVVNSLAKKSGTRFYLLPIPRKAAKAVN